MNENPSFSIDNVPETSSPIFTATRLIAGASDGAQIIAAVRDHLMPDADRLALFYLETEVSGKQSCQSIAVWDRDNLEPQSELPIKVQELIASQPLVVIDTIYLDEFLAPLKAYMVDTLKATSFAIVPLIRHEKTIGYFEVVTRHPGLNNDHQVRALLLAAWQIAPTLESLILVNAMDRARTRQAATIAALRAIVSNGHKETLAEAVTASIQAILPIAHLSVALRHDSESPDVEIVIWYGPDLPQRSTFNGSLMQQALKSGSAVWLDGLNTSAVDVGEDQTPRSQELEKLIIAPMIAGDQPIGTLNFGFGSGVALTTEDRRLAEEIAAHLAAIFASMRILDNLRRTLEETTTLYSTSLAMTAAQTFEEIYGTLLAEMGSVSESDRIILYLAGPDARDSIDYVEVAAVWKNGKMQAAKGQLRYPLDQAPVLSQFPQSRSNLIFNDTRTDPRLDRDLRNFYAEEKVNALTMIPLSTGTIWLGAVLAEAHQGQTFSNEQIRLCRSLADQAALALDTHLLLARYEQVIGRERALRDVSERIRQAATVDEILTVTSEELGKVTGINSEKLKSLDLTDSVKFRLNREEREFINSVQNQVRLAIDNLKLIDTTREAAEHEQALRDIASALNSTLELDEVLALILSSASRVLPHDAANVLVVQNGFARAISTRGYAERGINEDAMRALRLPVAEVSNLKRMIETRQPFAVPDTNDFPGWVKTPETDWVQSYIGAPIYIEDEIIGFLNLDSATANEYTNAQADRLQAFANQAAIAIRNAQMYQSTRLQAAVIGNVTTNLQSATGVDNVMETAVRALSATLGDYDVRLRLAPRLRRAGDEMPAGDLNSKDGSDEAES